MTSSNGHDHLVERRSERKIEIKKRISVKSAAALVGTPKAAWLARNFVWWSRWDGEGKGLVGTHNFFVVRVRVRVGVRVRVRVGILRK